MFVKRVSTCALVVAAPPMAVRMTPAQAPAGEPGPVSGAAMQADVPSVPQKQLVSVLAPSAQFESEMHSWTSKQLARSAALVVLSMQLFENSKQAPFCSQSAQAVVATLWQLSEQVNVFGSSHSSVPVTALSPQTVGAGPLIVRQSAAQVLPAGTPITPSQTSVPVMKASPHA